MNRRDFLKTASGVTGTAAVAGAAPPAVAQEGGQENETTTSGNDTAGNESDGNETAGGGGGGEVDPHELGVPFQAHFVGIATLLAIFVSLVFSFYVLKYGESPHSSSPNRK